jgi:hypothetical protein
MILMVKVFFKKGELFEAYPNLREASHRCKGITGAFIRYDRARQNFVVEGIKRAKEHAHLTLPIYTMVDAEVRRRVFCPFRRG